MNETVRSPTRHILSAETNVDMPEIFTRVFKSAALQNPVTGTVNTGLFINGKYVDPIEKGTIEYVSHIQSPSAVTYPAMLIAISTLVSFKIFACIVYGLYDTMPSASGKLITKFSRGTAKDVDAAVKAAETAFKTTWGTRTSGSDRGRLLNKLADLMEQNIDELAAIEALDGGEYLRACSLNISLNTIYLGKTFVVARHVDIVYAINNYRYYAGWADKNQGKTIEVICSLE